MSQEALSLRDRLRGIAAFRAAFEAPGFVFGEWAGGERRQDGASTMPWYRFSETALAFLRAAGVNGWVSPDVNWTVWQHTDEARGLWRTPETIRVATPDQLRHLLTMVVRGDRFSEGALAEAWENGVLLAIVRRAADLIDDPDPSSGSTPGR